MEAEKISRSKSSRLRVLMLRNRASSKRSSSTNKAEDTVSQTSKGQCTLDVIIESCQGLPKDKIPGMTAKLDGSGQLVLQDLIAKLKSLGFLQDVYLVSYLSEECGMYVFCGQDPLPPSVVVPKEEFSKTRKLTVRVKKLQDSIVKELLQTSQGNSHANFAGKSPFPSTDPTTEHKMKSSNDSKGGGGGGRERCSSNQVQKVKRTKERRIGEVVEKVSLWRRLYNGFSDHQGNIIKLTLEDAAQRVGVSKKSLDDYLLHIRSGRRFGFNFNEHSNDNFGVLRAFIKKSKGDSQKRSIKAEKPNLQSQPSIRSLSDQQKLFENRFGSSYETFQPFGFQEQRDPFNGDFSSFEREDPLSFLEGGSSLQMEIDPPCQWGAEHFAARDSGDFPKMEEVDKDEKKFRYEYLPSVFFKTCLFGGRVSRMIEKDYHAFNNSESFLESIETSDFF